MTRQTAAQKAKSTQRHQCGACNEIFTGRTCPNCGETVNIFAVNKDGVATSVVSDAIGGTPDMAIKLTRSPEFFDPNFELDVAMQQQFKDVVRDANLDKAKTLAAEQAAKRLRAEKELEATEKGFTPVADGEQPEAQGGFAQMSPGIFLQALGGWDPEQREHFLNQLAANPMLAFNLSMMMNPSKSGGANPMNMMNPLAMMGGMMQGPAEPAQPQASTADMLTSVIAAVSSIKEMSDGDGGSKQMDRLLDEIRDMRKDNEELRMKLVESQSTKQDVTPEDIRRIVAEAVNTSTDGKIGLINGLKEIHTLRDELIGLGIAQEPTMGIDPSQTLEERRLDHEIRMDEKRESREYDIKIEEKVAEQAAADAKSAFISGLFSAAAKNEEEKDESPTEETTESPTEEKMVEARPSAVIS